MRSIHDMFSDKITVANNFIVRSTISDAVNQQQTNKVFSEKWEKVEKQDNIEDLEQFQKKWFMSLYGFENEEAFRLYLANKNTILDAGCGLGYKSAWLASLAPHALVIGMDFSEAAQIAAGKYSTIPNLYFIQGDIAVTGIKDGTIDFVLCDQVIMHTEDPGKTFDHLSGLVSKDGEFACYVYAKKALPRELLDDYFRSNTHTYSSEQLWEMSKQLTELGKRLSELNIKFNAPDIPLLGIKGGEYDVQRFIYWNFLKCFWKEDWTRELCDSTNFDWYSPSNAKRYTQDEFIEMAKRNNLKTIFLHTEEACHSGRFSKICVE